MIQSDTTYNAIVKTGKLSSIYYVFSKKIKLNEILFGDIQKFRKAHRFFLIQRSLYHFIFLTNSFSNILNPLFWLLFLIYAQFVEKDWKILILISYISSQMWLKRIVLTTVFLVFLIFSLINTISRIWANYTQYVEKD